MTRLLRSQFEDALYCIMVEGNKLQAIFRGYKDQSYDIDLLSRYRERLGCRLYRYNLLTNHLYTISETQRANIGRFMQGLATSYVSYFNRRYKRRGTLFEGRYKSLLVPKDQLIDFTRQIHPLCRWITVLKEKKNGINPTLDATSNGIIQPVSNRRRRSYESQRHYPPGQPYPGFGWGWRDAEEES